MAANRLTTDLAKKEKEFNERKTAGKGKLDEWVAGCDAEITDLEKEYQKEVEKIEAKI